MTDGNVVFLWWCGGVFVVVFSWWCLCGDVFCGGVVVFLWWWGCVFVVVVFFSSWDELVSD